MKIVTFNIRTRWDDDGINSFIHRIGLIYEKINEEQPDVMALQEVTEKHIDVLRKIFPDYVFVGSGRHEDGRGEGLYTAYLKSSFELTAERVFWLSDTPSVPGSRFSSQSIYPRICVYTLLSEKRSGESFAFYNVHLDYLGAAAHTAPPTKDEIPDNFDFDNIKNPRKLAIERLLIEIMKDAEGEIIILGDFNATSDDECLPLLYDSGYVDLTENAGATFHNFGNGDSSIKIDYIFAKPTVKMRAKKISVWRDKKNGIYLSDHYPVAVEIQ